MVFANPIAGAGRPPPWPTRSPPLRLRADGYAVRLMLENPGTGGRRAGSAAAAGVVIAGGDGTLRAVADQLQQHGNAPPLLTVPLGSANLMARHLEITRMLPASRRKSALPSPPAPASAGRQRVEAGRCFCS